MQSLPLSLGLTNGSEPALLASNPASWAASNPLSIEGEGWGRQSGVVGAGKDEVRRDSRRGKKRNKETAPVCIPTGISVNHSLFFWGVHIADSQKQTTDAWHVFGVFQWQISLLSLPQVHKWMNQNWKRKTLKEAEEGICLSARGVVKDCLIFLGKDSLEWELCRRRASISV